MKKLYLTFVIATLIGGSAAGSMDSQDPEARIAAVKEVTDQKVLAKVARKDKDWQVRKYAVERLTDQKELKGIARKDEDSRVRLAAVARLSDQKELARIAQKDKDTTVKSVATMRLTDQQLLTKLATGDDLLLANIATPRVTDETLLKKVAAKAKFEDLRDYAMTQGRQLVWNALSSGFQELEEDSLNVLASSAKDPAVGIAARVSLGWSTWDEPGTVAVRSDRGLGDYLRAVALVDSPRAATGSIVDATRRYRQKGHTTLIPELCTLLLRYGDKTLAEEYLNSDSDHLKTAAVNWALKNEHVIDDYDKDSPARLWGPESEVIVPFHAAMTKPVIKELPSPTFPREALMKVGGPTYITFLIGKDGQAKDVGAVSGDGALHQDIANVLHQAALEAVSQWTFEPATDRYGKAVAVQVTIPIPWHVPSGIPVGSMDLEPIKKDHRGSFESTGPSYRGKAREFQGFFGVLKLQYRFFLMSGEPFESFRMWWEHSDDFLLQHSDKERTVKAATLKEQRPDLFRNYRAIRPKKVALESTLRFVEGGGVTTRSIGRYLIQPRASIGSYGFELPSGRTWEDVFPVSPEATAQIDGYINRLREVSGWAEDDIKKAAGELDAGTIESHAMFNKLSFAFAEEIKLAEPVNIVNLELPQATLDRIVESYYHLEQGVSDN